MQYSQEHLKTMVYAEFGGQTECVMGNWKIENGASTFPFIPSKLRETILLKLKKLCYYRLSKHFKLILHNSQSDSKNILI